jgi:ribosome-binding factor A
VIAAPQLAEGTGMKESGRTLRVADHLREELAEIIRRDMRDPRVGMISINDARVTRDLAYADIYVSTLDARGTAEQQALIDVLNRAAGFLRTAVARNSTMRTTPQLRFHYDESIDRGVRMDSLINQARRADEQQHQPDRGEDE